MIELIAQTRIGGYGTKFYDPVNEVAEVIANFNKTKTLTIYVLKICKSIGMTVTILPIVDEDLKDF
jgi:hypothetical protein